MRPLKIAISTLFLSLMTFGVAAKAEVWTQETTQQFEQMIIKQIGAAATVMVTFEKGIIKETTTMYLKEGDQFSYYDYKQLKEKFSSNCKKLMPILNNYKNVVGYQYHAIVIANGNSHHTKHLCQ
ncbi:hypothetical protein AB4510_22245 [Vibrio sp. 10N.222.54.B12]|uniref:hypothetical protein n=1 Tax=unclassified Vibrio TaxID=2614977 RepID=UPI000C8677C7|nr:hypothetical protein [Vibrio sp. 10N.286.49.B3]PMH45472.1 hypothetical protein BCU68_10290 [Vibrio sp. 10N.286.49.B3]